jgi:asparagine synthase (glutamine-hydrolysing)
MCGIFGRFAWNGAPPDPSTLAPLVDLLRHRGPDGGGTWSDGPFFFGHRRLSIIDLDARAAQPMRTADGSVAITYNGEIYNFVELRAELESKGYAFRTTSDTEVLLHGWDAWGESLPAHLVGMFAFAIADRRTGTMFLARDRFGEKPLLYCEAGREVVFASELAPIAAWLGDRRALDLEGLGGFLCLNYVPLDRTLMAGVRRLPPATTRTYGPRGLVAERRYWTLSATRGARGERRLGDVLADLRTRVDEAVRIALRADVPLALFLSGGIDSSVVAESAVRQGTLGAAFCVDIGESTYSEWDNAAWVAQRLGLRLERVSLGPEALGEFLDMVAHADDPLGDSSTIPVWNLARATAREFKVAVSGDGGDELFGGYVTYKATALHRRVTSRLPAREAIQRRAGLVRPTEKKVSTTYKLLRFLRAMDLAPSEAHFTWNGTWLPADAARLLSGDAAKALARGALHEVVERHQLSSHPPLSELQLLDATEYLPNDILTKVDRMTMAHSLESRAPLLDHRVADLALAETPRFEQTPFHSPKRLLRALADQAFGPRISRAKKQGFSIPVHAWLRGPHGRPLVEDLLSDRSIRDVAVLDPRVVGEARTRLLERGEPLGFEVWGLMVLVAWYRARVLSSVPFRRVA